MHDGTYKEGEQKQELQITVRFNIKHNPGTEGHLKQVIKNYLAPKGVFFDGDTIIL